MFDVVILAGGGKEKELIEYTGLPNKAFIPIHGKPMLAYVLEALKKTGEVGRVVVVGPIKELAPLIERYGIIAVPEARNVPENLRNGVAVLQPRAHFLIVAADLPFLKAEAVSSFIKQCKPYEWDFYYPIVSKEDNERRFPGVKRTYVKLRDGTFTGGNLFLLNPASLNNALSRLEQVFSLRKSPIKLAGLLGSKFIFRFILRQLTLSELEARFSVLFALSGKAVVTSFPEIGTDVDKPSDLELAKRELL
ncbi:MAG: 2-phospho-L-lactate guanylyltransferase [Syntrophomonadaceae bacterium]|nr:2-phospho-L-lactate guanylyltransferase [Bacillota bacterium]